MFYSQFYVDSSEIAADIFRRYDVTSFPVNPVKLAHKSGITVVSFSAFSEFTGIPIDQIACISSDGFSVFLDDQYFIVYNPHVTPKSRRRWTLMHEYCHIRLGHVRQQEHIRPDYLDDMPSEAEANELTCCLIAPLPVALMCGINSEEQFASCFGVSQQASINLYDDYNNYRTKNYPLELGYGNSLDNFRPFILDYNRDRYKISQIRHCGNPNIYCSESEFYEQEKTAAHLLKGERYC